MSKFRYAPPPSPDSHPDWRSYARAEAQWLVSLVQALEKHSAETDQPTKEVYSITGHTTTTGAIDFSAATAQQVANVLGTLIMTSLNAKGITRTKS